MSYLAKTTDLVVVTTVSELISILNKDGKYYDVHGVLNYLKKHNKIINNYGDYQIKDDDDNKFYPINTIVDKVIIIKHRNVFIKSRQWIREKYTDVSRAIVDNDIPGKNGIEKTRKLMNEIDSKIMK